jgi:hypothetical protein
MIMEQMKANENLKPINYVAYEGRSTADIEAEQRQQERKRLFQEVALALMSNSYTTVKNADELMKPVELLTEALLQASEKFAKGE